MDTRTAGIAVERHLNARQAEVDAQNDAADQCFYELKADHVQRNWSEMQSADGAATFVNDWIDDPAAELAEMYQECAKVRAGLVFFEDAARICFRIMDRRVESVSTTQAERQQ